MPQIYEKDSRDFHDVEEFVGADFYKDLGKEERASSLATPQARMAAEEDPVRYAIYRDALKHKARVEGGVEALDPERLEKYKNYLTLLNNLESYIAGKKIEDDLYGHQINVFEDFRNFLGEIVDTKEFSFGRSGYVESPTATGKTVLFVKLLEALNGNTSSERASNVVKALVLVPTRAIRQQTLGERGERGFALLDEDTSLRVSSIGADGKYSFEGDVVVMTYSALLKDEYLEMAKSAGFNVIICDEAHRAIGPKTQNALKELGEDKIMIGLTATAEYAVNHSVGDVFDHEIHQMSYREAGEMGIIQPIQGYVYSTGIELDRESVGWQFTQEEYDRLIHSEGRTQKGIEFARELVGRGLQGIVACVPGENRFHAKHVAEQLSQHEVTLPDGTTRMVRAVAIDAETADQDGILAAYSRGEIDVLCYVGLLNEGWDEQSARFLINLRPTDSPVLARQRLGRVLRKNPNDPPAIVIDFVDQTKKLQQTFIQMFELTSFEQGRVFSFNTQDYDPETAGTSMRPVSLPEWMVNEITAVSSEKIYDQVIRETLQPAPEDFMSLREAALALDVPPSDVYRFVKRMNLELEQFIARSGHISAHLSPGQFGEMAGWLEQNSAVEKEFESLTDLAVELEIPLPLLKQLVEANGLESERTKNFQPHYRKSDISPIVTHYQDNAETNYDFNRGMPLTNYLVLYPELDATMLMTAVKELGIEPQSHIINNKARLTIDERAVEKLNEEIGSYIKPPEGGLSLPSMGARLGIDESTLRSALIHVRGVNFDVKRYVGKDKKPRDYIYLTDPEQMDKLEAQLALFRPPEEGSLTRNELTQLYDINDATADRLIKLLGISWISYRRSKSGAMARFINPEHVQEVKRYVESATPPEGWTSAEDVLYVLGLTPSRLAGARQVLGITPTLYRHDVGGIMDYYSSEDVDSIIDYLTQRQNP